MFDFFICNSWENLLLPNYFVFKNTNVSSRVLYSFLFLKSAWKNTVFCYVFGKQEQKGNNLAHKGLIFPCLKFVQKFMRLWSCYFNLEDILVWECKGGNVFLMKICKILVSTTFWVACINPGSCQIILCFYLENEECIILSNKNDMKLIFRDKNWVNLENKVTVLKKLARLE